MPEYKRPLILPPVWFAGIGIAMVLANHYHPLQRLVAPPYSYTGAGVLAAGLAIAVSGVVLFGRAKTGLVPFNEATTVVTNGVFRYTRNPMYLGMTIALAGLAILLGTLGAVLLVPVFPVIMHYRFILPEEQFMQQSLGQRYLEYKARVRRWL